MIYGTVFLSPGISRSDAFSPGTRESSRVERSRVFPPALFLAYLTGFIARTRALRSRCTRPLARLSRQGRARDFLLFAARRAERRETMAVYAAKLKPPTDFSYFADEHGGGARGVFARGSLALNRP